MKIKKIKNSIIFVLLLVLFTTRYSIAENVRTIVYKDGMNLRSIALEYLNDENMWTEILKFNNIASITDLKPNMKLKIPAKRILDAEKYLASSLKAISKATTAGARVLASNFINEAIDLRDKAIQYKKKSEWKLCADFAKQAEEKANLAYKESVANQHSPVEAIIDNMQGDVQSKKQNDLTWVETEKFSKLVEEEKVRTLSKSSVDILFRDDSRLKLSNNSQAVVQKMRVNSLKNEQKTSIQLVEGDIFAILSDNPSSEFDLDISGIKTEINSTDFWVNKDQDGVQFANYQGEIEVGSGDSKIKIEENQGVAIGRKGYRKRELLEGPELTEPGHNSLVLLSKANRDIIFHWTKVDEAVRYMLEICKDESTFKDLVVEKRYIRGTSYTQTDLPNGTYFWRVTAFDEYGIPGKRSEYYVLRVLSDDSPPFLTVASPTNYAILKQSSVVISGESETGAVINAPTKNIRYLVDGKFELEYKLDEGFNEIELLVADSAGNTNSVSHSLIHMPKKDIEVSMQDDPHHKNANSYVTPDEGFTFVGFTEPMSEINIAGGTKKVTWKTFSDSTGYFVVNVPLESGSNDFDLSVKALNDDRKTMTYKIEKDDKPPKIIFDEVIPDFSFNDSVVVKGELLDGISLEINGKQQDVINGKFRYTKQLKIGSNIIELRAVDFAGNETIISKEIVFDNQPPRFAGHNLSQHTVKGGESLRLSIKAKDSSELSKLAYYKLECGGTELDGFIKYSSAMKQYHSPIVIPRGLKGKIKLKMVKLSDCYGNEKVYNFN